MRKLKPTLKYLFAVLFIAAGSNHFFSASFYIRIMPPYLPRPLLLVYLSGSVENILGGLLLIPDFARAAAWGLVALLIAVLPANIHMAVNHGRARSPSTSRSASRAAAGRGRRSGASRGTPRRCRSPAGAPSTSGACGTSPPSAAARPRPSTPRGGWSCGGSTATCATPCTSACCW